jgi:hypothetical protein
MVAAKSNESRRQAKKYRNGIGGVAQASAKWRRNESKHGGSIGMSKK